MNQETLDLLSKKVSDGKGVPSAVKLMPDASMELPYDGAKEMILVDDVDNREFLCKLIDSMWEELPAGKKK